MLLGTPGAAQTDHLVAWEATSAAGRATYFFRLLPREQAGALADPAKAAAAVEAAIQKLNRALVLLIFRREPIYLPDDKLETQPQYRRYAACRKIPGSAACGHPSSAAPSTPLPPPGKSR